MADGAGFLPTTGPDIETQACLNEYLSKALQHGIEARKLYAV